MTKRHEKRPKNCFQKEECVIQESISLMGFTYQVPHRSFMEMFSFLKKKAMEKKSSRFSTFLYQPLGTPLWTENHFEKQVRSGYYKNPIVYRCVNLIARSIASVPIILHKKDVKILRHPVLDLLQYPNPLQSRESFLEALVSNLLLSGNGYVESVFQDTEEKFPMELYSLRPDRLSVIPGKKGIPLGYEYRVGGEHHSITCDPLTGYSPLLHIKFFNPLNDWYGLSPLIAAQSSIDLHNIVISHNVALLQNEGRPSGALIIRNGRQGLTENQRATIRSDLERLYAGKDNAGKMMILEGDFEWKEMGFSPKDLDFTEGRNYVSREITKVFGVPPLCIGLQGDATFSNYREARAHFWEETVLPLWHFIFGHINQWLNTAFRDSFVLSCDKEKIDALSVHREKVWDRIKNVEFLTINEKRALIGFPPLSGQNNL